MKPADYNIEIYKGDTYELFVRVRERLANGDPGDYLDLTGATGKAQVRASEASPTVVAEFTVTLGNQTLTPGAVLLSLSSAETTAMVLASAGRWDFQITFADGKVRTLLRGTATLILEVTRA
jgi:hypothetical protein